MHDVIDHRVEIRCGECERRTVEPGPTIGWYDETEPGGQQFYRIVRLGTKKAARIRAEIKTGLTTTDDLHFQKHGLRPSYGSDDREFIARANVLPGLPGIFQLTCPAGHKIRVSKGMLYPWAQAGCLEVSATVAGINPGQAVPPPPVSTIDYDPPDWTNWETVEVTPARWATDENW